MSSGSSLLQKPTPAMTGVGQRMPSQQAIILRPGGGGQQITLPGGQTVRQQPVLVNASAASGAIRVQAPGIQARPGNQVAANRNVLINQSGGSQISVPLHALQSMQAGQGIPTGQAGHLLVKTETGQYQIVKVGPSATVSSSNVVSSPQIVRTTTVARMTTPTQPQPQPQTTSNVVAQVQAAASNAPTPPSNSTSSVTNSTSSTTTASSSSGSGGMGGTQMTPDTAKHKCKNFLATLLKLAGEQPANVRTNVHNLIQGLIDGNVDPETFTTKLQRELNSSPQPCLVPFLKRSLPFLQASLSSGELSIEGVRAPAKKINAIIGPPASVLKTATVIQRGPSNVTLPTRPVSASVMRNMSPMVQQRTVAGTTTTRVNIQRPFIQANSSPGIARIGALNALTPSQVQPQMAGGKKPGGGSGNSYSTAGDEDINDVAAMGGVNLAEESQRMQAGTITTMQQRSCKDETFLQTGLLHKRIAKICLEKGLEEPSAEVIALVSHATQDRLKTLLEKLSVISEHRLDIVRQEGDYEVTQDVKGQLRFLGELDKIERRRHEEAERELLLRAAKSRTKTEDPEKEKLKNKAKELQRIEEEQQRHEMANNTALMAIGGPRKKLKLDSDHIPGPTGAGISTSSSFASRPRMKRVHVRDLLFLMEQEKELKRSPLLWKAHCS